MRIVHTLLIVLAFGMTIAGRPTRCLATQGTPAQAVASQAATAAPASAPSPPAASTPTATRRLDLAIQPKFGDFDAMLDRRLIRVLVPYSRTSISTSSVMSAD